MIKLSGTLPTIFLRVGEAPGASIQLGLWTQPHSFWGGLRDDLPFPEPGGWLAGWLAGWLTRASITCIMLDKFCADASAAKLATLGMPSRALRSSAHLLGSCGCEGICSVGKMCLDDQTLMPLAKPERGCSMRNP